MFVGTSGLHWDDVSTLTTPALWRLSREGSVGLVAARGVTSTSCPADGWLAVSTGSRSGDLKVDDHTCRALADPGANGLTPAWSDYVTALGRQAFGAEPGLLGDVLAKAGTTVTGIGPGAAIALADSSGRPVGTHVPALATTAGLTLAVQRAVETSRLVVVDAGSVRDAGYATVARIPLDQPTTDPTTPPEPSAADVIVEPTRAQQAQDVDARVDAVLEATRGTGATVIVLSLADSGRAALQFAAAVGPAPDGTHEFAGTLLTSGSTRQSGLVQSTDVTPTLLAALGLSAEAPDLGGSPLAVTPGPASALDRLHLLLRSAQHSLQVTMVSSAYTTYLVLVQAALFLAAAIVLTRAGRPRGTPLRPALRALQVSSLALAAAPAASFLTGLVPWWTAGSPTAAFWLDLFAWIAAITALALVGPWHRHVLGPAGTVAAITVLVLVLDSVTGSTLVVDSPMGAHRILAARFYGLSNQAFALLTSAGLLLAAVVANALLQRGRRWLATAAVAAIGLVITVVDGAPGLGSDFGGPPALILGFAILTLVVSGTKVTWRRLLVIAAAIVVVVGGFAVVDFMRPAADRTHIGRFLASSLDGGLWDIVYRKLSVNLRVLTSWRYLLLAIGGALLTWVVVAGPRFRRGSGGPLGTNSPLAGLQEAVPLLRPTVAAIGVALALGFVMNDSGIVVPATGIAVAVPCLVAAAAQWRLGAHLPAPTTTPSTPVSTR